MLLKKLIVPFVIFSIIVTSDFLAAAETEAYSPYPGTLVAELVAITSASSIELSAQTWPGYKRTFAISLASVDVPQNSPDVSTCERKLADKALAFVKGFLSNAKKLEIHDMTMKTSSDQNAEAEIYTEQGSLSKALSGQGLARPKSIAPEQPWC